MQLNWRTEQWVPLCMIIDFIAAWRFSFVLSSSSEVLTSHLKGVYYCFVAYFFLCWYNVCAVSSNATKPTSRRVGLSFACWHPLTAWDLWTQTCQCLLKLLAKLGAGGCHSKLSEGKPFPKAVVTMASPPQFTPHHSACQWRTTQYLP